MSFSGAAGKTTGDGSGNERSNHSSSASLQISSVSDGNDNNYSVNKDEEYVDRTYTEEQRIAVEDLDVRLGVQLSVNRGHPIF